MKFLSTVFLSFFLSFFLFMVAHAKSYDECKTILEKCQNAYKTFKKDSAMANGDACITECQSGVGHCNWGEPNGQGQSINQVLSQVAESCGECWDSLFNESRVQCWTDDGSDAAKSAGYLWGEKKITCWLQDEIFDAYSCIPCGYKHWKELNHLCNDTFKEKCKGNCSAQPD